jgi:hypothetical protein
MSVTENQIQYEPQESDEEIWTLAYGYKKPIQVLIAEALKWRNSPSNNQRNIFEEKVAIETIQQSDPTDIQAISASKLTLSNSFYNNALRQSQQSFLWALILAAVGALFIILTVTLVIVLQPTIAASIIIALLGGTGGVGSSAIAYATLQLYKQASEQAAACHIRLDRASDFILANSACEGLDGPEKTEMRTEIIRKLVELRSE